GGRELDQLRRRRCVVVAVEPAADGAAARQQGGGGHEDGQARRVREQAWGGLHRLDGPCGDGKRGQALPSSAGGSPPAATSLISSSCRCGAPSSSASMAWRYAARAASGRPSAASASPRSSRAAGWSASATSASAASASPASSNRRASRQWT